MPCSFVECGFDSLALMQIGVELGKKYAVTVALRDLMEKFNTLPKLAAGKWTVKITWAGDANYLSASGTGAAIKVA